MSLTGEVMRSDRLAQRVRAHLQRIAVQAAPITYRALAEAMDLSPPNTILQVTKALEKLMKEDAANGHPFIAALVVSKVRNGLPAPGFFDGARQLGRFGDNTPGPEESALHEAEFAAAVAFWGAAHGMEGITPHGFMFRGIGQPGSHDPVGSAVHMDRHTSADRRKNVVSKPMRTLCPNEEL